MDNDSKGLALLMLFFLCISSCTTCNNTSDMRQDIDRIQSDVDRIQTDVSDMERHVAVSYPPLVEGVLVDVKHEEGTDVLIFEEEKIKIHLGTHEVYPGEWNCVRLNSRGYVEEVFLGEDWREGI